MKYKTTFLFATLALFFPAATLAFTSHDVLSEYFGMSDYVNGEITAPHCMPYGTSRKDSCQFGSLISYTPAVTTSVVSVQFVFNQLNADVPNIVARIQDASSRAVVATSTPLFVPAYPYQVQTGKNIVFTFPNHPPLQAGRDYLISTYWHDYQDQSLFLFSPYNATQQSTALHVLRGILPATSTPLTLANPTETEDDNNQDGKGVADKTVFTFGVTATGTPDTINLVVGSSTIPLAKNGDTYAATSTFPKGHYTYHFETSGGIKTPDQVFTAGYSNVAFLPGLEASRLYTQGVFFENQLWEPNRNDDVRKLYLNTDGTSVNSNIYTRDIIDEKNVSPVGQGNIYKSFISSMDALKASGMINNWKPLPYDWRFDVRDIVDRPIAYATTSYSMVEEIQKLAADSDTGKVTIIGHSNGGLVAKFLANKLGADGSKLLDQMIFVASPQAGTPQAVGVILHGFDQGLPFDSFPLILTQETARNLAVNMPSAYGLLPSSKYFTYVDDPVISFDNDPLLADWRAKYGIEINSAERLHNFLADQTRTPMPVTEETKNPIIGNATLLNNAENLHNNTLDNWSPPPGVALTQIAGWGEDTLKSIVYYQGVKTTCTIPGVFFTCTSSPALEYKMKMVLDGDGTVVVPSALWTGGAGKYLVDLDSYNKPILGVNRKHADILEVPNLLKFLKNLMTRNGSALPLYISTSTPPNDTPEKHLRFTLHSPLTLDLYDNLGNHTGISTTTGFLEENIPGTRYRTFGELKYISVPASTTLRLSMNGYATGSFTLDMEEVSGNTTTASTTFAGVPSTASTIATINIPQGNIASSSPLFVDTNGDGTADFSIAPKPGGVAIPDFTPPEAAISFSTTVNDVIIAGTDAEGMTTTKTTTTSTTITDTGGNTLVIPFIKYKDQSSLKPTKLKIVFDTLIYNGRATTTPKTTLEYEWGLKKDGTLKEMEQNIRIKNTRHVSAEYDAKKNRTKIVDKIKGDEDDEKSAVKITKLGIVPLVLSTKKGAVGVTY